MSRISRLLLLLLPLAMFAAACSSYEAPRRDVSALSKLETGIRHDCNAMMGTVFRATEEREWFEQNCSRWPAVAVAQAQAPAPSQPQTGGATTIQGDSPDCAAMRGRPYSSEQDRAWFLQNCLRPEVPAPNTGNLQTQPRPGVVQPTPLVNANAAVCDTLRRSPNITDEQRRWYFTYCDIR